jgi:hypothetical protein
MAGTEINPVPTDDEAAAIVAAIEGAWPRGAVVASRDDSPRWRWSGRWWTKPMIARRDRPWM